MAWSDQCKVAFQMTVATKKNIGEKQRSDRAVLKEVAQETDIPFKTLERWWHESKCLKNEASENAPEKEGSRRPVSQDQVWKNVARRINSLCDYISKNAEFPPEEGVKAETAVEVRSVWSLLLWHMEGFENEVIS